MGQRNDRDSLYKPNEIEGNGKGQCSSMRNAHAYLMKNISSKKDCIADTFMQKAIGRI